MPDTLKREIAIIGLGRMGGNLARRLREHAWTVIGYNKEVELTEQLVENNGVVPAASAAEAVQKLSGSESNSPRIVWLMVPAGAPVDEALEAVTPHLTRGDIVIDGGNSFYKDSAKRALMLSEKGIAFLDIGVSGGPGGARNGASLMIGGNPDVVKKLDPLFKDLAVLDGYAYMGEAGAGHFVKMVHNGIEYGMMQAIAEGYGILRASPYKLNLSEITRVYNHGTVIESRLIGWLKAAFIKHGEDLNDVSGSVGHTGEGEWTVNAAKEMGIEAPVIEESFQFRVRSKEKPSYIGKVLSALREQFGWHSVK
jgi:6-phosphogluconate dehydrogenase